MPKRKICYDINAASLQVNAARARGLIICSSCGIFDVIHLGHIHYLQKAKELGDFLVIMLNSDSSTKKLKGEKRPIQPQQERAELLAALECVDLIVIFDALEPTDVIRALKPDRWFKGGDYKDISEINQNERKLVEELGGTCHVLPTEESTSTTKLIQKIIDGELNATKTNS